MNNVYKKWKKMKLKRKCKQNKLKKSKPKKKINCISKEMKLFPQNMIKTPHLLKQNPQKKKFLPLEISKFKNKTKLKTKNPSHHPHNFKIKNQTAQINLNIMTMKYH